MNYPSSSSLNYQSSLLLYIIKAAKASKDAINTEVQQLLLLKASYKKLAGHDYQPPTSSATSSALPTPTTTTTTTSTGSSISVSTKTTKESSSSSKSNKDSHKPTTTPTTATTNSITSSTVSLFSNPFEGLMNDPDSYVLIIIHTIDNTSNNNNNSQTNIIEQQDITRCILIASLYNITLHIINRDDSIYKATVDKLSIIPIYPVLLHNKHMIFTATAICRYISALKSNSSSSSSSSSSDNNMVDRYLDWYDYSLVPSYSKIIMTRTTIDTASQGR